MSYSKPCTVCGADMHDTRSWRLKQRRTCSPECREVSRRENSRKSALAYWANRPLPQDDDNPFFHAGLAHTFTSQRLPYHGPHPRRPVA